jgi:peptide/nickel transport system permease protein
MPSYLLKRTVRAVVTLWLVVTLTFGMIRLLPGGPLTQLRGQLIRQGYPPQQITQLIETYQNLQPDAPLYVQYYQYVTALVQGDLGQSFAYPEPVAAIIADALPWTVFVMVISTVIIFAIAIVGGALMAYKEGSTFDTLTSGASILLASIPFYVLAIALIVVFGYKYGVFPVRYRVGSDVSAGFNLPFVLSAIRHAILPIVSLVVTTTGLQVLAMRGNSISVLGEDYVRVARLRGIADGRIAVRYVGRNAILPMYTGFLTLVAGNLGGSVILEEIFTYNGVGYYLFQGLQNRDYPLMMGIFLVITAALVISVYIADLTYGRIDPRVQTGDSSEAY